MVTGGAGFIGSTMVRNLVLETPHKVINIDKLTYAGNLESLEPVIDNNRHVFRQIDICNQEEVRQEFYQHQPDLLIHFAAESHVDRSIDAPGSFITTNVIGTYNLLEQARRYWAQLDFDKQRNFRFLHISTDEVYGDLETASALFTEDTAYAPSSPYAASKAGSDHLVRAWHRTYDLPTVIVNCSNNYGPYQYPEKLIPLTIINAIHDREIPIYGKGDQVRDWLFVEDHVRALLTVLLKGRIGETYNIGGHNEKTNYEVVATVCAILDELMPIKASDKRNYIDLVTYVTDRPGHDRRYAIDATKINSELGWTPDENFETGIRKTIEWYLENKKWWSRVMDGSYRGERLGLGSEK